MFLDTNGQPILDTIHHCKGEQLLAVLPKDSIDMMLTSPPYDNLRSYNGYSFDFEAIACESYRVLKLGGVLVWIVGDQTKDGCESLTSFKQAIYFVESAEFKLHDTMIWQKTARFPDENRYYQSFEYMFVLSKGTPKTFNPLTQQNKQYGRKVTGTDRDIDGTTRAQSCLGNDIKPNGVLPNVWFVDTGYMRTTKDKAAYDHPAMFPESLAERHILTWSNPGDIVLDYFMGSGTTAKMARKNERHYIGCDISLEYVTLANRRLSMPYTPLMFVE